jgi:hypothetical protein
MIVVVGDQEFINCNIESCSIKYTEVEAISRIKEKDGVVNQIVTIPDDLDFGPRKCKRFLLGHRYDGNLIVYSLLD